MSGDVSRPEVSPGPAVLVAPAPDARRSLWTIFRTLFAIGIGSFGGGSSTLYLIHTACLKLGWMTEEEFVRTYALVQIAPGINLIKLVALLGMRLRGWPGLLMGLAGMLLPSAGVTVLMTAGYAAVRNLPAAQAALRGILPATIGLSLAMAVQMAAPLLAGKYRPRRASLAAQLAILAGSALMLAAANVSPLLILLVAGGVSVLLLYVMPGYDTVAGPRARP